MARRLQHLSRGKAWCFTINNYDDYDYGNIIEMCEKVDYLIVGFEVSKEGTEHMQGFLYVRQKIRFSTVCNILQYAHVDRMKAKSPIDAIVYCQKDGNYYEYGQCPQQGKRNDLNKIQNDLRYGKKTLTEIAHEYPTQYHFHYRSMAQYRKLVADYDTIVYYYQDHEIPLVYEEYAKNLKSNCLIIQDMDENCYYHKFLHFVFSKEYKLIFIPYSLFNNNPVMNTLLKDKVFPIE